MVPNAAASNAAKASPDRVGPGDRVGADQRYELVERIGSGGMGAVYRAKDHKLGCERAVKVLDSKYAAIPAFVERFRREAMAASRITHPNIVSVVDVAGEGERPVFLVMELLEGKTISQLIRGQGRLPWSQVRRYLDQIAAGLGAAHAQGVVHRDVKPGNCLVLADEQVKVLDFGIAKVTDMPAEVVALTAAGEIIGTCSYMAPEQIRGQVDKRSDIYALGVLAFRMLTGRVPFSHADQDKVLLAHLTEPAPAPSTRVSSLSAEVDAVVLRMLAKQPHQRFGSMDELRTTLARMEDDGLSVEATTTPPDDPAGPGKATMFDNAPTRAMIREAVSSEGEEVGRPTINTAPAGSGALTEFDGPSPGAIPPMAGPSGTVSLEAGGPSGTVSLEAGGPSRGGGVNKRVAKSPASTVLLGDEEPPKGRTVVADGPPSPPASLAKKEMPAPPKTEKAPSPRKLVDVASADGAPPRVTRMAAPADEDEGGGMVRGVLAAAFGVGLAIAVVAGWGWWSKRGATEPKSDSETPPVAAPAVEAEDVAEPKETAKPEPPVEPADEGADAEPAEATTAAPEPSVEPPVEPEPPAGTTSSSEGSNPKRGGRRGGKRGGKPKGLGSQMDLPEPPPPDPDPKPDDTGPKPGDLRDPF